MLKRADSISILGPAMAQSKQEREKEVQQRRDSCGPLRAETAQSPNVWADILIVACQHLMADQSAVERHSFALVPGQAIAEIRLARSLTGPQAFIHTPFVHGGEVQFRFGSWSRRICLGSTDISRPPLFIVDY